MAKKAPEPTLEIFFQGVFPEDISTRDLANTVDAVQGLSAEAEGDRIQVRIVGIKRGSARYLCTVPDGDKPLSTLRRIGAQIQRGSYDEALADVINPIHELSALARRIGCSVVLRDPSDKEDVIASIGPGTYDEISSGLLTSGAITITGFVERVGGATGPRCILRLPHQERVVFCTLETRELARRLGAHVYSEVVASGRATWVRGTHRVVRFRIKDIKQAPRGPLQEAFAALRKAGGSAWDHVRDPEAYLAENTGD